MTAIKNDVATFGNNFLSSNPKNYSIQTGAGLEMVDKHVPSKLSKSKFNLPWITEH